MEWLEAANRLETVAHQLASAAHEVNNMLQVVSGSAEMLRMAPDVSPAVLRRADAIGGQAQRAAALLTDVLGFSRDTSSRTILDLRELVARAVSMRRYAIGRARIEERMDLCTEDATVRANPRRLLQLVLNLILRAERALDATPEAILSVTVTVAAGEAVVQVDDNAASLPEDASDVSLQCPIEEPNRPPSLGIGVPVASWLATEEGGRLVVAPRSGGGTSARLAMPLA